MYIIDVSRSASKAMIMTAALTFALLTQGTLSFVSQGIAAQRTLSTEEIVVRTGAKSNRRSGLTTLEVGSIGEAVNDFYMNAPIEAAFITCAVKASAADALAQFQAIKSVDETKGNGKTERKKAEGSKDGNGLSLANILPQDFHIPRNIGFLLYGGFYQGIAQYFWYNICFPAVFGTTTDPLTVTMKVLTDAVILAPHLNLPISYSIKAAMYGSTSPIQDGVRNYVNDAVEKNLLFKFWALWIPVNAIVFGFVPEHLRIPFMAMVSFFWLNCLSSISCSDQQPNVSSNRAEPIKTSTISSKDQTTFFAKLTA